MIKKYILLNYNDKKLKEKNITEFCCRTSCRSFLLLTESRFIYKNVIPLCKLLIILCASTWKTIIPTLLTLFPFPLFIVFKLSFKTTFNSVFFLSMLSSTAYGRKIIPAPHICYSIIVQMIDFLVNCISAPYIIKICDFVALCSEDNIRREFSSFAQNIYRW